VFGPGRYANLRQRHEAGLRPLASLWKGYAAAAPEPEQITSQSAFDEGILVLRQVDGRRFGLESTLQLCQALRRTLMGRSRQQPAPEWLSGHLPDGQPSQRVHLAIFPLAFVDRKHADGHLLGLGLALPREAGEGEPAELLRLLEAEPGYPWVSLVLGQAGHCDVELDERPDIDRPYTLRPAVYSRPAQRWATVTPVVLDQFPRRQLTAEDVVAGACERVGLPRPVGVRVGQAAYLSGVPASRAFPALPTRAGRPPRPLTHAEITFDVPVRGPVLLGAGRYLGYGLCRPRDGQEASV
jgi:CRISPR-associated protein Csb2